MVLLAFIFEFDFRCRKPGCFETCQEQVSDYLASPLGIVPILYFLADDDEFDRAALIVQGLHVR